MKILNYLLLIIIILGGCSANSEHPPTRLNEFMKVYEKGFSIQDFKGYKIQTRGDAYLVGFPGFDHWFVYNYDKGSTSLNLDNIETLLEKNIITETNSNFVDSLNREAFRRVAIISNYKIIKVDGKLDNNKLIEVSFNAEDVLAYIGSSNDSVGRREEFLRTNAQKLSDNWYYLKRDLPLDLSNY